MDPLMKDATQEAEDREVAMSTVPDVVGWVLPSSQYAPSLAARIGFPTNALPPRTNSKFPEVVPRGMNQTTSTTGSSQVEAVECATKRPRSQQKGSSASLADYTKWNEMHEAIIPIVEQFVCNLWRQVIDIDASHIANDDRRDVDTVVGGQALACTVYHRRSDGGGPCDCDDRDGCIANSGVKQLEESYLVAVLEASPSASSNAMTEDPPYTLSTLPVTPAPTQVRCTNSPCDEHVPFLEWIEPSRNLFLLSQAPPPSEPKRKRRRKRHCGTSTSAGQILSVVPLSMRSERQSPTPLDWSVFNSVFLNRDVWVDALASAEVSPVSTSATSPRQSTDAPCPGMLMLSLFDRSFFLPPRSGFAMSDISDFGPVVRTLKGVTFDFVSVDPPWDNKSVTRFKTYPTLSNTRRMFQLLAPVRTLFKSPQPSPSPSIASRRSTLVGVWITNNPVVRQGVIDDLFRRWNVRHVATWYWLKVDHQLIPVTSLRDAHRKPYEILLLGRYAGDDTDATVAADGVAGFDVDAFAEVPARRVICSPTSEHSRKPPLLDFVSPYLQGHSGQTGDGHPSCLDLFAREVRPNFFAWGNEPLHFQESRFLDAK